jgi:putative acyl-CoA dehydrogenase
MADVILLTAPTNSSVSFFLAPRILPDGSQNGIYIQRLRDKLGNRSNASSEIEMDGTLAYLLAKKVTGFANSSSIPMLPRRGLLFHSDI